MEASWRPKHFRPQLEARRNKPCITIQYTNESHSILAVPGQLFTILIEGTMNYVHLPTPVSSDGVIGGYDLWTTWCRYWIRQLEAPHGVPNHATSVTYQLSVMTNIPYRFRPNVPPTETYGFHVWLFTTAFALEGFLKLWFLMRWLHGHNRHNSILLFTNLPHQNPWRSSHWPN